MNEYNMSNLTKYFDKNSGYLKEIHSIIYNIIIIDSELIFINLIKAFVQFLILS